MKTLNLSIKVCGVQRRKGNHFRVRFHLQLFPPKFSGCAIVLLVLFLPAALAAYVLHNVAWLVVVPVGIIALALIVAGLPSKGRRVTPAQFADEIERHLLGADDAFDWDDTTSIRIADERLERIRWELPKFDSLAREEDKAEPKAIIEALRRGELPEVVPVKDLTYR
jgi:hypothetical protein